MSPHQPDLLHVDWTRIPAPTDDGGARHLEGARLPDVPLPATDGAPVSLARVRGRAVVYAYPRTGVPGEASPVEDWDQIPGARGCTPQSCAFRDHFADLRACGVTAVFGLSSQTTAYQQEMARRLHLPFPVLSDAAFALTDALRLPTMDVAGMRLLRRLAWVQDEGRIVKVFYPVFPPDRNAADVLAWCAGMAGSQPSDPRLAGRPLSPAATDAIYLDHQATTPVDPEVLAEMLPYLSEDFGNAGSRTHAFGWSAAGAVDLARRRIAGLIQATPDEVVFTSGATESNLLAIVGAARAEVRAGGARRHLVSSPLEHPSVLACS